MTDIEPITTLAGLTAPFGAGQFMPILRQREPRLVRGGEAARYRTLLDWQTLIDVAADPDLPAKVLRLSRSGHFIPKSLYRFDAGARVAAIDRIMADGGSITAYGVEPHVPALDTLCRAVGAETGEHVIAAAIGTVGPGGAFSVHYDDADLLALQIDGAKHWTLLAEPVVDPVLGMPFVPAPPAAEPYLEVVLEPGDMLFVPGGYRHFCATRSERSLHLSILFNPLTLPRVAEMLMREMFDTPADRRPLRFDPAEAPLHEAALRDRLAALISELSLADLIERHRATDLPVAPANRGTP